MFKWIGIAVVVIIVVNDFHKWAEWSSWDKMDSTMKKTYSGSEKGVNAVYSWESPKMGSGEMLITKSAPNTLVEIDMDSKPMKTHLISEFKILANGKTTDVTWTMTGKNSYRSKLMSVFMNFEKMTGSQFEVSLNFLKQVVETAK